MTDHLGQSDPLSERTPGEKLAYVEGYAAALKVIREAVEHAQGAIELARSTLIVGTSDEHTLRGQHGPGCGCLDGQYCCEQRDEWYERHGQPDDSPLRGRNGGPSEPPVD